MTNNRVMLFLGVVGLAAAWYWNKQNTAQWARVNARLNLGVVDPATLPGAVGVELPPVFVDTRPGVYVDPITGDAWVNEGIG